MTERQVVLVVGPPCSGKSTYVREHAQPGDMIVDYDLIARQLGSPRKHGHDFRFHRPTERRMRALIDDIGEGRIQRAWVIRSAPDPEYRTELAETLRADRVEVIDAPDRVLLERAKRRPNSHKLAAAIRAWRVANPLRISHVSSQHPHPTP